MRPAAPSGRVGAALLAALSFCTVLIGCNRAADEAASRGGVRPPVAVTASAAASTVAQAGVDDSGFLANAAAASLYEVQLGQLAGAQAADSAVKVYASMLVDDLTSANNELVQLAAVRGVVLPTQPSREAQAELKKLGRESGAGFDRSFVGLAVKSHRRDVDDFESAARRSQADDLKAWIERALPTLRQHLDEGEKLAAAFAVAPAAAASGVAARSAASGAARLPGAAPRPAASGSRPAAVPASTSS